MVGNLHSGFCFDYSANEEGIGPFENTIKDGGKDRTIKCLYSVYTVYIVYTVYTACAYTIQTARMPRYILAGEDLSQLWD